MYLLCIKCGNTKKFYHSVNLEEVSPHRDDSDYSILEEFFIEIKYDPKTGYAIPLTAEEAEEQIAEFTDFLKRITSSHSRSYMQPIRHDGLLLYGKPYIKCCKCQKSRILNLEAIEHSIRGYTNDYGKQIVRKAILKHYTSAQMKQLLLNPNLNQYVQGVLLRELKKA